MATVYVLRRDEVEDQQVIDIYTTREAAEQEIVRAALAGRGYQSVQIDDHEIRTSSRTAPPFPGEKSETRIPLDTV